MPRLNNERLCVLAQEGDVFARNLLLENNLGFIHKTTDEIFQSMGLEDSGIGVEFDDLLQEGSLGLLNAIGHFDAKKNIRFLTYAAPAIRNAMMDLIRAGFMQFEHRITDTKNGLGFQMVRLDDVLPGDERMQRLETIADPTSQLPEEIYLKKESMRELYDTLKKQSLREQTWLLYRFGFTDGTAHPLLGTAMHFRLSESRAKQIEEQALDNLRLELPWWYWYTFVLSPTS